MVFRRKVSEAEQLPTHLLLLEVAGWRLQGGHPGVENENGRRHEEDHDSRRALATQPAPPLARRFQIFNVVGFFSITRWE